MTHELRNIISGTGWVTKGNTIQTALNYLRKCKKTSRTPEKSEFFNKENEVEYLTEFALKNSLLINDISLENFIGEGAEQKVYLLNDGQFVVKINDAIFYEFWEDYLVSLLIHNYLFPSTAYELIGFHQSSESFYSVVRQHFIVSTQPTDLSLLRIFLENNGFIHKKNNDYYNPQIGIILEDLHDENVLTNQNVFFFIDTVIYLNPKIHFS